jgi:hypothetical protein
MDTGSSFGNNVLGNHLQVVDARLDVSWQAIDGEADLFQANLVTCLAQRFQTILGGTVDGPGV